MFKDAQKLTKQMTKVKKCDYFKNQLKDNIAKPSKLWKVLKTIGLPSNANNAAKVCLKDENNVLRFEPKETCNVFKNFYENLAQSLVDKLPPAPNKFNLETTKVFYESQNIPNTFKLQEIDQASILIMLKKLMQTKPLGLISSQVFS
ncbi:MAG: hypothetical protein GY777_16065, partial [Candidatus Brocadiaceae bacterium]|nr:hypothetical protein [Candidatus Brocadiaceae bacterium]